MPDPDWKREVPQSLFHKGPKLIAAIRRYQRWENRRGPVAVAVRGLACLSHQFWTILCGADIPLCCSVGGGLVLKHPNGVVIHPYARIGVNCTIFQQVTIGEFANNEAPTIGNAVYIGAGAKLLGPIHIGDFAKIGANAVVLCDIPPGATAIGVPARIIEARTHAALTEHPADAHTLELRP